MRLFEKLRFRSVRCECSCRDDCPVAAAVLKNYKPACLRRGHHLPRKLHFSVRRADVDAVLINRDRDRPGIIG
jgi:hypothetical protein